jgi:hypothetical protein
MSETHPVYPLNSPERNLYAFVLGYRGYLSRVPYIAEFSSEGQRWNVIDYTVESSFVAVPAQLANVSNSTQTISLLPYIKRNSSGICVAGVCITKEDQKPLMEQRNQVLLGVFSSIGTDITSRLRLLTIRDAILPRSRRVVLSSWVCEPEFHFVSFERPLRYKAITRYFQWLHSFEGEVVRDDLTVKVK